MRFSDRYCQAIASFDSVNAADPNREEVDGVPQAKELVYARRMTARLERFRPDAPEPVWLAVRSQHIRRWTVSRGDYPAGREGYRRWRTDLGRLHASTAAGILKTVGYDAATISRVESLLRKERLKVEPDAQLLEDVICLVFLEYYLVDFAPKHDEDKLVGVLQKTWRKMSDSGREAALQLDLPTSVRTLVERALASRGATIP